MTRNHPYKKLIFALFVYSISDILPLDVVDLTLRAVKECEQDSVRHCMF